MANQKAFYFDSSACTGCKVCQVACQDKNDLPAGLLWRRVFTYGGGSWIKQGETMAPNNLFAYSVSTACQHCENPVCANVCPTAAISKRADGIVVIDAEKCIGCRYCQWACPYGAPQLNEEAKVMTKCDFCYDLQDQGLNPACVDACVMRCLDFGDLEELRQRYGNLDAIEPLPTGDITKPALVITPHKHAQMSGQGTGRILNLPEEV
ncbi:MAG: dimethylsulfoxide reductase subunit B [Chloroflexi bacterium]|nr:dimethylsulfoxide reductase subunit B [Chloroflexota bacterium]